MDAGMFSRKKCAALLLVSLGIWLLSGCGGGGNGGASVAGRAALDVYVTDGFSDQYKQVLATLYKIELSTDGTTFTTVFSDTTGRTLDLASLASTSELLGSVTVTAGTYTQARITFGDHLTLVSNSGTSTSVAVSSSAGTDTNGQVAITVSTPTRVQANQTNAVYVDFKLAEFQLIGNTLTPVISCGGGTPTQQGEQHTAHLLGTVSNIGSTGFTLTGPNGRTITVTITNSTTITSGQTGATITLANGQRVFVDGTYDPSTSALTATAITLDDYTTIKHAQAVGTVASINSANNSFVLTVQRTEGIQPTGGTITVVATTGTAYMKGWYQQGSFSDIAVNGVAMVDGTFDTTTQTLTARSIGLLPAGQH
jgi:hypothetical protein